MIGKTMLGLLVLAIGLSPIPAFAESETILSPHQQFQNGTPLEQIQCRDSKILMETPRNTPACVNENSVERLEGKEFVLVDVVSVIESESNSINSASNTVNTETNIIDEEQNMDTQENIPTRDSINYDSELMSILEKDLVFTSKKTNQNVFSELGHGGINWPMYNVTFPRTAQVGIPFDVVYDYSFVIPDEETGDYVNFNEQCSENRCGQVYFSAKVSSFVSVESDNLEYFTDTFDQKMIPMRNYTHYQYHPEFDNTQPLQETFTFVINEPDDVYKIGEINVSIKQNNEDLVYFYVDNSGTVIFDPMLKKETFEQSSFAKSDSPSVRNTASAVQELEKENSELRQKIESLKSENTPQYDTVDMVQPLEKNEIMYATTDKQEYGLGDMIQVSGFIDRSFLDKQTTDQRLNKTIIRYDTSHLDIHLSSDGKSHSVYIQCERAQSFVDDGNFIHNYNQEQKKYILTNFEMNEFYPITTLDIASNGYPDVIQRCFDDQGNFEFSFMVDDEYYAGKYKVYTSDRSHVRSDKQIILIK